MRELLAVAVPLAVSTGGMSVAQVVDRTLLARLDPAALAAALPAGMLHWALLAPVSGVGMTTATFVAQHTAAGRPADAARAVWQGVWVAAAGGLLFLLLRPLADALFAPAGHPPAVAALEAEYFRALCLGAGPSDPEKG